MWETSCQLAFFPSQLTRHTSPFSKTRRKGVTDMKTSISSNTIIQLIIAVGVLVLLWQVIHQMLPSATLLPYVVVSLLSILAFMAKSRFK
jgi:Na+/citrate or Na+/malate symporter